jgi:2-iminobutanoate/2-iminopropanoate deaminase
MARRIIDSEKLPRPFAQYSNAVSAGGFLFTTGHIGLDPTTGKLVRGGIGPQTRATLDAIRALLEANGMMLRDIVTANVYLADYRDFWKFDEVYKEYFPKDPPARTTVRASTMKGMKVEINVVAHKD